MSEILSKYIATFVYFDKTPLDLPAAVIVNVSNISFATVIGEPVGITSTSLNLVFSISSRNAKTVLKIMRKKGKNTTNLFISKE